MKQILFFLTSILACCLYAGCTQNEIELYNQAPRINFESQKVEYAFADSDYVKKTPYITIDFTVRIQGNYLTEQRSFCLKSIANSDFENPVVVELENKYIYTALDTVCQKFQFKIMRPEMKFGNKAFGSYLEFNSDDPNHQFEQGMIERHRIPVSVSWRLRPRTWKYGWGEYSDAKYMFMMDVCGYTMEKMTTEDHAKVVDAYQRYKDEGNSPILDDKGVEITF